MVQIRRLLGSTSFKVWLWQAGITAAGIVLLTWYLHETTDFWLRHQFDQNIRADLQALVDEAETRGITGAAEKVDRLVAAGAGGGSYYLVTDAYGLRLAGNIPEVATEEGWFSAPVSRIVTAAGRPENREHILRGRIAKVADGRVAAARDVWSIGQIREEIWRGHLTYMAVAVAVTFAVATLASMYVRRRIQAFAKTSASIMAGDLKQRIALTGRHDEFDELARQMNQMLDRIQDLMADISQVTMDIAHDLRSPLARLRQGLEDARRHADGDGVLQPALSTAVNEADSILDIFAAMLRIAQIESGSRRSAFRAVSLNDLVTAVGETYAPVAEDRGQSLRCSADGDVTVEGDPALLQQLLWNLVENALVHAPVGTHVGVAAARAADAALLTVIDDGPGIPIAMRAQVLKPFVRLDPSRKGEGTGLGLATVAAIVRLHGGKIELADNKPGLRVTVHLPITASTSSLSG